MAFARIVVATTTSYPDKGKDGVRAELALATFRRLRKLGYPVVVVDNGSYPEWRAALAELAGQSGSRIDLRKEEPDPRTGKSSMGAGRRQALSVATQYGDKDTLYFWMEPEKKGFVRFIKRLARFMRKLKADLLIPARRNLKSYPIRQQHAEAVGNGEVSDLLGRDFDFWFGPFVMSRRALKHMLDYNGQNGYGDKWDSIMVPRLLMMADPTLLVKTIKVGYRHPKSQRVQETGDPNFTGRRFDQLSNIVPALRKEIARLGLRNKYRR